MLKSRLIPCLLIHEKGLVKTKNFKHPHYIGDPINTIKIFNEKNVDELFIADIDASVKKYEPDYKLISKIAFECRMPLCYAGGIKEINQAIKIIELGVEKVALSSAAIENPIIISNLSKTIGSQSVVVALDVKMSKFKKRYEIFTHNGKKATGLSLTNFIKSMEDSGAGEIIINSIDKDGTLEGYDLDLIDEVYRNLKIPLTFIGGASSHKDFEKVLKKYHPCGIGASSIFIFKGKHKAVLIQYPNDEEKYKILKL